MTDLPTERILAAQQTVDASPLSTQALLELGNAYFEVERYAEAKPIFERVLALDPKSVVGYNALGHLLYRINALEDALAVYERAVALDPYDEHAYYGIGILWASKRGNYVQALAALQRGLEKVPNSVWLKSSAGGMYARMGRYDDAWALLQPIHQADPVNQFVVGWLQILHLKAQRFEAVVEVGQRVLATGPSPDIERMMGYARMRQGRWRDAMAYLAEVVQRVADDYEARGALSWALRMIGQIDQAEVQLRTARSQVHADDVYGRACLAAVTGETAQALALLEQALHNGHEQVGWARIDPEFTFLSDEARYHELVRQDDPAS